MWDLDEEKSFREDLSEKVISWAEAGDGSLSRKDLGNFQYAGVQVRLIDPQGGIWNPGASWTLTDPLRATLSINTTRSGKYEDEEMAGGLWRYDYQSGGIEGKNSKLRKAMELQLPLLWFKQIENGKYVPYKVYVINDYPDQAFCFIAPDIYLAKAFASESVVERKYAERVMKQRLHQPAFRAKVMSAYETKCAVCLLGHGKLLDAAHITPDREDDSSTQVSNGLALCKIHHSAYDIKILGIDANYKVHIQEAILNEVDGPMLEHGIKEMAGRELWIPTNPELQPNRDRLDQRFREFLNL